MSGGSLEVQETGRALKVHTETPHLVSLGGGRLSTAVTLHPLPEGRTTVGSGQGVDIAVQGTGVEPIHCHIDNQGGVVTLIPQSEMTSVDQIRVSHPTRLSQGCMLCVGRSNTFRFNHPAEARLMKSVLPNPRISMLPIAYYPGDDVGIFGGVEGKPPPAPRRSGGSRDSWGELSSTSSDDLATRMEMAKFISPKVFPPGSCTVNSPASVVLGPRSNTPSKLNLYRNNQTNGSSTLTKTSDSEKFEENLESQFNLSQKEILQNGNRILNGNIYQNVCALPNGQFVPRLDSPNSRDSSRVNSVSSPSPSERGPSPGSGRPSMSRAISTPSPAFDRNPSYFSIRKSVTSPTASWDSSIEDLTSRKGELEGKRKQAENERVIEQETERLERLRLEEILTMCADYEKQAQWERLNKPQQNRIITNGSLPRDKRLPSPHSPQINQSFTFDTDMTPTIPESFHQDQDISRSPHLENVKPPANYENVTIGHPNSPRTRIKTILSNKESLSREYSFEVIENKLAILSDYEILGPPPPPRNSSKHIMNSTENQNILNGHYIENELKDESLNGGNTYHNIDFKRTTGNKMENYNHKPASIAESNALSKYEFFGFDPRNSLEMNSDSGYQKEKSCSPLRSSSDSLTSNKCKDKNETFANTSPSSKSISRCNTSPSWTNPSIVVESLNVSNSESNKKYTYPASNGEYTTEQLIMQLDAIVRGSPSRDKLTPSPGPSDRDSGLGAGGRDSGKFILPLPDPAIQVELQNSLRLEKIQLMTNLTSLKTKVTEIRQKEEELMREEIEQALVGGELQLQNEKLTQEESRLNLLRDRMTECDKEMDKCVLQQTERQTQSKQRLEQQQAELQAIEERLNSCTEDSEMKLKLMELLRQKQEILEAEKKSFEDMEFSLLEGWLSRREEVQREVNEICNRCEERREKIKSLEAERDEAERHANANTKQLQVQLIEFLRKIEEGRNRLSEIDLQLQNAEARLSDQEADRKRSQDDLERISRVTSGAPMEMSTNSLGRRTIASLQEIERNRHLHLAKQGSLVIEEERKRVSELKRRVQDEARAEWEERRQRENNCHSLNSVGSEESSLTSSDLHTESASSEDVEKRLTTAPSELKTESPESEDVAKKTHERDELRKKDEREPDSRPLSDASTYSEDQLTVRLRNKSTSNLQRPLTRYLPIRGEALDLRQHIESAGHQVDLCPHVILDKTSCRGFLHKMTSRFHQWNKRWFVFDRTRRTLTYYSDRSERKPRGGAYFQAIEEVYVDHLNCVKSPNPQVTFVIKSSERTYHLVAPSPEAMRIWVDVIFTGAEGYQEFAHGS